MRSSFMAILVFIACISVHAKVFLLDAPSVPHSGTLARRAVPVFLDRENQRKWNIVFDIPSFEAKEEKAVPLDGNFSHIEVAGLSNAQRPGAPALPYYSFIVANNAHKLEVELDYEREVIFSDLKAIPARDKPCRCQKGEELFSLKRKEYFQDKPVTLHSLGDYRGRALTLVIIRPLLQWGDQIKAYKGLKVSLESTEGDLFSFKNVVQANKKMLLVAPEHLVPGMREFAQYKEANGFEVEAHTYESIAKTEEELRSFIAKRYAKEKFQYALFFGFENDIPPFKVMTSANPQTPSDFPFFAMGGAGDSVPDVFYGRIVARNNDDIRRQIEKYREFERKNWSDPLGQKRSIGIASNEGWSPSDAEYIQMMLGPMDRSFSIESDYFFQDQRNSNPRQINESLNEGAIWLNYIGHGSGTSWSSITKDEYSSSDIAGIQTGKVKPVIIDVACQNGRFNNQQRLGETFMMAHKKGLPTGAVAFFGGSVDISWDPPAVMAVAINNSLTKAQRGPLYEFILKGQLELLNSYEDIEAAKENFLWYHLLGDPSLTVDFAQ